MEEDLIKISEVRLNNYIDKAVNYTTKLVLEELSIQKQLFKLLTANNGASTPKRPKLPQKKPTQMTIHSPS